MSEYGRVLLADDEDLFRDTTADLLRKRGYTVDCASNAAEALILLSANQYDVLISDIKMPGNAELELVLKVNKLGYSMPIILVTAYPALNTAVRAVNHAVAAYLIKPPDLGELFVAVKAAVTRSRLYQTVADLRKQLKLWGDDAGDLAKLFLEPLSMGVTEPAKMLLTTTFAMVAKSLVNLRRASELLDATENPIQPEEIKGFVNTSEIVETALRETIQALEESKYVFKSKRLKELRQQLQGVLGVLEREKAASIITLQTVSNDGRP